MASECIWIMSALPFEWPKHRTEHNSNRATIWYPSCPDLLSVMYPFDQKLTPKYFPGKSAILPPPPPPSAQHFFIPPTCHPFFAGAKNATDSYHFSKCQYKYHPRFSPLFHYIKNVKSEIQKHDLISHEF